MKRVEDGFLDDVDALPELLFNTARSCAVICVPCHQDRMLAVSGFAAAIRRVDRSPRHLSRAGSGGPKRCASAIASAPFVRAHDAYAGLGRNGNQFDRLGSVHDETECVRPVAGCSPRLASDAFSWPRPPAYARRPGRGKRHVRRHPAMITTARAPGRHLREAEWNSHPSMPGRAISSVIGERMPRGKQ